MMILIRVLLTK